MRLLLFLKPVYKKFPNECIIFGLSEFNMLLNICVLCIWSGMWLRMSDNKVFLRSVWNVQFSRKCSSLSISCMLQALQILSFASMFSNLPVCILRQWELSLNFEMLFWICLSSIWSIYGSRLNSVLKSLYVLSIGCFSESLMLCSQVVLKIFSRLYLINFKMVVVSVAWISGISPIAAWVTSKLLSRHQP